mmetsp:Transcript_70079/g.116841  ORF Transcript_70079/g.116841 Transcript_70079/m.116841 type:complete len:377 (+) Transcript_70079:161-1291(+)
MESSRKPARSYATCSGVISPWFSLSSCRSLLLSRLYSPNSFRVWIMGPDPSGSAGIPPSVSSRSRSTVLSVSTPMLHVGNWCSATRAQSRTSSGRLSFSWSISSAWRTCVQPMLGRSRFIFSHTTIAAVLSPRSKWPSINSSQRSGKVPTFSVTYLSRPYFAMIPRSSPLWYGVRSPASQHCTSRSSASASPAASASAQARRTASVTFRARGSTPEVGPPLVLTTTKSSPSSSRRRRRRHVIQPSGLSVRGMSSGFSLWVVRTALGSVTRDWPLRWSEYSSPPRNVGAPSPTVSSMYAFINSRTTAQCARSSCPETLTMRSSAGASFSPARSGSAAAEDALRRNMALSRAPVAATAARRPTPRMYSPCTGAERPVD